jgi:hypothetical protein
MSYRHKERIHNIETTLLMTSSTITTVITAAIANRRASWLEQLMP